MTATIHQFTPRRKAAPQLPTRSVELAFVLAIVDALAADAKAKCLGTVMTMGDLNPDCESSSGAAAIARSLSKNGRA